MAIVSSDLIWKAAGDDADTFISLLENISSNFFKPMLFQETNGE